MKNLKVCEMKETNINFLFQKYSCYKVFFKFNQKMKAETVQENQFHLDYRLQQTSKTKKIKNNHLKFVWIFSVCLWKEKLFCEETFSLKAHQFYHNTLSYHVVIIILPLSSWIWGKRHFCWNVFNWFFFYMNGKCV